MNDSSKDQNSSPRGVEYEHKVELDIAALDRQLGQQAAEYYVLQKYPEARLLWGGANHNLQPDNLDQVWQVTDKKSDDSDIWLIVAAKAGEMKLRILKTNHGLNVQEGSRDYLEQAVHLMKNYRSTYELAQQLDKALKNRKIRYIYAYLPVNTVNKETELGDITVKEFKL